MEVGETGVGEMGQIIGETEVGEMGVGETGTSHCFNPLFIVTLLQWQIMTTRKSALRGTYTPSW